MKKTTVLGAALAITALPAVAGDAALRALEATIQQQAIIQQQQQQQQQRQQQEQMRQREAAKPSLITGPDGAPIEQDGRSRSDKQAPAR